MPPKVKPLPAAISPVRKRHHVEEDAPPSPRPMQDLWKEAFPVGTEWDQYDRVYEIDWNFSNLEEAFQEGGKLYGEKVFLFGCTEPQLLTCEDSFKIVHIPAVVAVVSPHAPSDKVGIKSIQMEGETVVSMKEMKMDWVPYIPIDVRDYLSVERYKCQIFTLKCGQRRVALRHLKQERVKKYEYCLPYFSNPLKEEEVEPDTVVPILYPFDGGRPPLLADFDWDMDDYEEFTETLVMDETLPSEEKDKFKDFVRQTVSAEKKQQQQARKARQKEIEEMNPETKAAYENMRFYKFYPLPSPGTPDISGVKEPFINRYYGKASEVL